MPIAVHYHMYCIINSQPVIVDTGISTYETGDQRKFERSTSAHNTVVVNNQEQSQVWGSFRVAKRAKVEILVESNDTVVAKTRWI